MLEKMSFVSTLTILTLCGLTLGGHLESNTYIDKVLDSTCKLLKYWGADVQRTSGWDYEFKDEMKGKVSYDAGELRSLTRVARHGNCNPPFRRKGKMTVQLNCTLVFSNLETEHNGKLKYGELPKVSIKGEGEFDKVLVFIVVKQTPSSTPFLERLSIEEIGTFKPRFSGLDPLNKYLSILIENYTARMKDEVNNAINGRFFKTLNATLPLHEMPKF